MHVLYGMVFICRIIFCNLNDELWCLGSIRIHAHIILKFNRASHIRMKSVKNNNPIYIYKAYIHTYLCIGNGWLECGQMPAIWG